MKLPAHSNILPAELAPNKQGGPRLEVTLKGTPTAAQMEIAREILAKHYADLAEGWFGRSDAIDKIRREYEKALYGRLSGSAKKRRAFVFLRAWNAAMIFWRESGMAMPETRRLNLLKPLLDALRDSDDEFFKGLAEAMQIVKSYGKDPVNKRLLEYKMEIGSIPQHTPREIKEKFGSKFRAISVKKLHERCHELGIAHKDEPRGKASPNYRPFRRG
jgi:hypothetical protein